MNNQSKSPPKPDLSPKEFLFVTEITKGTPAEHAAVISGWSKSYARKNAHLISARPHVAAAIAEAQAKIRNEAEWTAERLLKKYEHAYETAEKLGQSMSMVRALDSIGKLSGLVEDSIRLKLDVPISLIDAIEAGKARVAALGRPMTDISPPNFMLDITPTQKDEPA